MSVPSPLPYAAAMRIGLIADTHMPGTLRDLWPQARDAFRDVDQVLHAGDLHTLAVVDELNRLAPIHVARGNGDAGLADVRLRDTWALEVAGVRIGMIHHFPSPERKSPQLLLAYLERHFGHAGFDVVVFGHTHLESVHRVGDMLCVNPGSPTLPRNQSLRHGTIGFLDIDGGTVTASIAQITDDRVVAHAGIAPVELALPAAGRR
jgi:hypothetical protein